jgi:hypothetical protein
MRKVPEVRRPVSAVLDAPKDFVYVLSSSVGPHRARAGEGRGMLRGHIDSLTPSGLVEGWAYDETRLLAPLAVAVLTAKGEEIASGYADLFRDDLALAGAAYGWCAFRLGLSVSPETAAGHPLRLVEGATRAVIFEGEAALGEDSAQEIQDLDALLASDPTVLTSAEQLESLSPVLDAFVAAQGVDAFVGAAYLYVLGRCADPSGLVSFGRLIRTRRLTPYAALLTLAEGPEFGARARTLIPPNRPGFPFLTA